MKSAEYTSVIKSLPDQKDRLTAMLLLDIRNQLVINALKVKQTVADNQGSTVI